MSQPNVPLPATCEIEEDYSLRDLMGGSAGIAKIFSAENVARAQKVIDDARDSFFVSNREGLLHIREALHGVFAASTNLTDEQFATVLRFVRSLKAQSNALQFPFIFAISGHIEEVCLAPHRGHLNYTHLIRDMLEVLRFALEHKITSDASVIGQDVMASLRTVSAKINRPTA